MNDPFEIRIRDIRRRIAELRSRIGYTQTRCNSIQEPEEVAESRQSVEQTLKRETELNDIKAKLMSNTRKL